MTKTLASPSSASSPTSPKLTESSATAAITVLTSKPFPGKPVGLMNKAFSLAEGGDLKVVPYQKGYLFSSTAEPINGIDSLGQLLAKISADPRMIVIRGLHANPGVAVVRRLAEKFPEHPQGTPWVMIDFDDIELPNGLDPLSAQAIEHCIAKLPPEFRGVTYFYQHSNSAGILNPDGTPRKAGLNAHVFFWLSRRISGDDLAAYLKHHCIQTGFYEVGFDKGGGVRLSYGIDPSVITSPIQAHYTAGPEIGPGVKCRLDPSHRQGFVKKGLAEVVLPALPANLSLEVSRLQASITDGFKREHGFKSVISQTRTSRGISSAKHFVNPNSQVKGGRTFVNGKLSADEKFFTLYFDDENSPGSYFVVKDRPEFAYRHGGDRILLKDLSAGAHDYVRDELNWFSEIAHYDMQLNEAGYLPPLASFAEARVSLVLAPTGSGKTRAAIDWIRTRLTGNSLVIYAAPTIALVKQMRDDLRTGGIQHVDYNDVKVYSLPTTGVIVTTNASLNRILGLVHNASTVYSLIVDEIHMGLDEFMRKKSRNETFENGLSRASQTLLLTGTMTAVQRSKIVSTVGHAIGGLTEAHFCRYEFAPVKRNPLIVRPSTHFDSDFMEMVEEMRKDLKAGKRLQRVVVLLDTSKMLRYRNILSEYGLSEQAFVVSRQEDEPGVIEAARVSQLPILIASPLFALGMNFVAQPELLMAKFDYIDADTNQINQAVNRANRGEVECEVRIYGNPKRGLSFRIPNHDKLAADVREFLKQEATLEGLLDEHFQIDPATYTLLRQAERNTQIALSQLVEDDAIQNYQVIVEAEKPLIDKEKAKKFKEHGKAARQGYLSQIGYQADRYQDSEEYLRFIKLEQLSNERREGWRQTDLRVEREISNEELGLLMVQCNLADPRMARKVEAVKVKRLFGEIGPWVSTQFQRESFTSWAEIEGEKTGKLSVLVKKLESVRSGNTSPTQLAATLTRNKNFRDGVLALANNEQEYLTLSQKFSELAEARKQAKVSGSDSVKAEARAFGLELLGEVLEPLGVFYERVRDGNKTVVNYDTLIVPATWDLASMAEKLERRAQLLNALPASQTEMMIGEGEHEGEVPRSLTLCSRCVFNQTKTCAVGYPIAWQGDESELKVAASCEGFKAFKP